MVTKTYRVSTTITGRVALALLAFAAALPAVAQKGAGASDRRNPIDRVQTFTENGIRVILSPADNQLVSVIVGLEGGLLTGESSNPELGEFTSDVITSSGSQTYSKEELRRFASRTSTTMAGGGDYRGINYNMTATRSNFDKGWEMLASMIREPLFDETEYRNIMQYRVSQVRRRYSNPDNQAFLVADSIIKMGHPVLSRWTRQEDIEAVTIPMMQDFQKRVSERSRMLVVVVGNVTAAEIKEKLKVFASLPAGNYKPVQSQPLTPPAAPRVLVVDKPQSPTTYVYGAFVGPRAGEPDYWPMAVGMSHLGHTLFEEIRTKRNLSYAPSAFQTQTLGNAVGMISVSSVYPDSSMAIMVAELEKMRNGEFSAEGFEDSKQVYITGYYQRQLTNSSKASALYNAERNAGTWKHAFSYEAIQAIDKEAVRKAFMKYARNLQVGVVGRKTGINENRYVFKE